MEIDPERADLVRFAFTAYATGDWSLSRLAKELTARGLTTRPTPSQPAKPVTTTGLHKILTNPYYQGTVTFRGVTYDGTHEPLVDAETWLRVQTNLDANNARGERPQKYDHYLKGTLYCACGAKLMLERPPRQVRGPLRVLHLLRTTPQDHQLHPLSDPRRTRRSRDRTHLPAQLPDPDPG
ncbi:recombinase family protein [Corynebacterium pseudodiphtheriticum]|uniref:recombinase family protein n=1 Tax=Corynebacterium pseudodiphtheriticum TaxID=37637 RepID=UPI003D714395